jgi:hypothetical protein
MDNKCSYAESKTLSYWRFDFIRCCWSLFFGGHMADKADEYGNDDSRLLNHIIFPLDFLSLEKSTKAPLHSADPHQYVSPSNQGYSEEDAEQTCKGFGGVLCRIRYIPRIKE